MMRRTFPVLALLMLTLAFTSFACDDFTWHGAGADGDIDTAGDSDVRDADNTSDGDGSAGEADMDKDNADGDTDIDKDAVGEGDAEPDHESDGDVSDGDADYESYCVVDTYRCNENDVLKCIDHGDYQQWEYYRSCEENQICYEGECVEPDGDVVESDAEPDAEPDAAHEFVCVDGVCTDADTDFEWQENGATNPMTYTSAVSYCQNLETDDGGWRLPNISELRTLARNCADIETDGGCGVQDVCPPCGVYSGGACLILATCKGLNCAPSACTNDGGVDGCYWSPDIGGTCGFFWSLSLETLNTCAYVVDFLKGEVACNAKSSDEGYARCVR